MARNYLAEFFFERMISTDVSKSLATSEESKHNLPRVLQHLIPKSAPATSASDN